MSHYHMEIWTHENPKDVEKFVENVLEPHSESASNLGFFDWYQVGGRWTGTHSSSYKPEEDPANFETCSICEGTGIRNDELGKAHRAKDPDYKCNGCQGKGSSLKWPTEWDRFGGDVIGVEGISDTLLCYHLLIVHENGYKEFAESAGWGGSLNVKEQLAEREMVGGFLITVDYHS